MRIRMCRMRITGIGIESVPQVAGRAVRRLLVLLREALVLDPSYRGTSVEELARELPCPA